MAAPVSRPTSRPRPCGPASRRPNRLAGRSAFTLPSVGAESILPDTTGGGAMTDARWERVGAATGIAFVVFIVISFLLIPEAPPELDDPISDIRSFYVDNASAWQANVYLTGIAAFFLVWFLGSLRTALERAEAQATGAVRVARIVSPAGAVVVALALVNGAVNDALATRVAAESDQAAIRALYDV